MQGNIWSDLFTVTAVNGTALAAGGATNIEPAAGTAPGLAIGHAWLNAQNAPTPRSVSFTAKGVVSTAASAPGTLTLAVALGSTVIVATPAFTPAVSLANRYWEMRGDLKFNTPGTGSQVQGSFLLDIANGAAATTPLVTIGAPANTAPASWLVTFDTTAGGAGTDIPFHIQATWGSWVAGDSIQCLLVKAWADN